MFCNKPVDFVKVYKTDGGSKIINKYLTQQLVFH